MTLRTLRTIGCGKQRWSQGREGTRESTAYRWLPNPFCQTLDGNELESGSQTNPKSGSGNQTSNGKVWKARGYDSFYSHLDMDGKVCVSLGLTGSMYNQSK